ncbi:MAG: single-stranded DNA-binding protein [Patescibacteria group bacterium]
MNLNKVILIGRLTRDPEIKSLPSGQQVASFGLATNRYFNDKSGQKQEQTDFHNIVLFGRLAEIASQYLKKGSLTLIEGRVQTRSWQGNDGTTKYRTEIVGQAMQLGPRSETSRIMPEEKKKERFSATQSEEIPIIEEDEIDIKDIPF